MEFFNCKLIIALPFIKRSIILFSSSFNKIFFDFLFVCFTKIIYKNSLIQLNKFQHYFIHIFHAKIYFYFNKKL